MQTKFLGNAVLLTALLAASDGWTSVATGVDATCETSNTPTTFTGSTLDSATPTRSGVVYDGTGASLKLQKTAGVFSGSLLGVSNKILSGCAADFDGDGWVDFVGTGTGTDGKLTFYKNQTYDNPAPTDWYDPTKIRTPKFVPAATPIYTDTTIGTVVTGCADLNGDGKTDVVLAACNAGATVCTPPNTLLIFLGNGNGTFQTPYTFVADKANIPSLAWSTNSLGFMDYNGDGKLDMVWGIAEVTGATGGKVIVALNDGAAQPKFDTLAPITLIPNIGFGAKGPDAIAVGDFTGDGVNDIVVGGVGTASLRLYPGLLGGGLGTYQNIATGFTGGATAILTGDFSLTGKKDVIVGTDGLNGYTGCKITYDKNSGTTTPFSAGSSWTKTCASSDLDMGWTFDYDHDPDHTPDFVMADGNNSGTYFLYANRLQTQYVTCGTVSSSLLDIGSLATQEMTVTDARIAPTQTLNNGTITWAASNDDGLTWHNATACSDNAAQYCATFNNTVGSKIHWQATLCSSSDHTQTPTITSTAVSFTYVTATNHFRAGPIAKDNLVYIGAFRQPGDAGHFFALRDDNGATVWDAASLLTTATSRKIYTVSASNVRQTFASSSTGYANFRNTLLVSDAATADSVVTWQGSARFGLTNLQVLGGIQNSTAALISPPSMPYWYEMSATPVSERTLLSTYVATYASRKELVLVGAADGALHAFYTNPGDLTDSTNGTEAWAFIPYDVAQRLNADRIAGTVTAYPDGSPTLASAKINGAWRTVLVAGEANGGKSVYALDVTQTIDPTTGTVLGPTPLWQYSDANMGKTYSKPTVIRTKHAGVEQYLALFASGAGLGVDVGDTVYAVDMTTGALVWRFDLNDTNCYVSTDITAAETDDVGESNPAPVKDGYIDRVYFGDSKGRLWKLDPGNYDATNQTINAIGTLDVGLTQMALFSTRLTTGGLGADRALSGTIAASEDATGRLALYFGTGGTEDSPTNVQNAFYAIYSDTGAIRSKLDGSTGVAVNTKFYGGVVINNGQLLFTSGVDLSGLGLCSPTSGTIEAIDANTFALQFSQATSSKMVAPLFVQNGEMYTVTVKGQVIASQNVGSSGVTTGTTSGAVEGSTAIGSSDNDASNGGTTTDPFTILSWRKVY